MAQALARFPAMTKGTSILDYLLTYEKQVAEHEKVSGTTYDENLKIGTVLKGLPNELRKHILIGRSPSTKYQDIRAKLLGLIGYWVQGLGCILHPLPGICIHKKTPNVKPHGWTEQESQLK